MTVIIVVVGVDLVVMVMVTETYMVELGKLVIMVMMVAVEMIL